MYVLGTAGHVDHGKSTLIKALTGIDPDRLQEEKDRQMTIDLGFAWFRLPSGNEVGIVDVPGHRDFIENMLAGIGGIDAVLFVVAADEGVMPQTREHLSILKLLQIKNGIIVVTKIDQVKDESWLAMVEEDVRAITKNTFLESVPLLRVSAMTKVGLDDLTMAIDEMLSNCPPKRNIGKARLPVDRVFTLKGFGTVVTGTLMDGGFQVGQQVELLPQEKQTRIRGIQSHKKKMEIALPGSRTAINLVGVDSNEIRRGNVVAEPGAYSASYRIDAKIEMLVDASGKIAHNDHYKFFIGASETIARLRLLGKKEIKPGDWGWVQFEFDEPIVPEKGDHFILRRPSPAETIAGGVVLDAHPTGRYKRFSEAVLSRMNLLDSGSSRQILLSNLEADSPIPYLDFIKKYGLEDEAARQEIESLIGVEIVRIAPDKNKETLIATLTFWNNLKAKIVGKIKEYYQRYPLRTRMPRNEMNKHLNYGQKVNNLILQQLVMDGVLEEKDDGIGLAGYSIHFSEGNEKDAAAILDEFKREPFSPPSLRELMEQYEPDLIQAMLDRGMLVRISDDIAFLPETYQSMVKGTKEYLKRESKITLAQFRDEYKTSRKYALALLEHLDKLGITARREDYRVLKDS